MRDSRQGGDVRRTALGPTRTSWTWAFLVVAFLLGVALVDFLAQNTRSTKIEFFWASGHVPLTAALLVAALAGAAVVLVVGIARIIQLRRSVRAGTLQQTAHGGIRNAMDAQSAEPPHEAHEAAPETA